MRITRMLIDCVTLFLVFTLGVGAGIIGCLGYAARGRAEIASRRSTLSQIGVAVVAYAETHGQYPACLEDALEQSYPCYRSEAKLLSYYVAGEKHPLEYHRVLFAEKWPRRYGFIEGRFEFDGHLPVFRLDFSGRREGSGTE